MDDLASDARRMVHRRLAARVRATALRAAHRPPTSRAPVATPTTVHTRHPDHAHGPASAAGRVHDKGPAGRRPHVARGVDGPGTEAVCAALEAAVLSGAPAIFPGRPPARPGGLAPGVQKLQLALPGRDDGALRIGDLGEGH